jgi:UDP-N-acetylglucosamine 2-epimerase (non-hydrolysing)
MPMHTAPCLRFDLPDPETLDPAISAASRFRRSAGPREMVRNRNRTPTSTPLIFIEKDAILARDSVEIEPTLVSARGSTYTVDIVEVRADASRWEVRAELQKILAVVGTRPEVIKMAPVIRRLKEDPRHFQTVVCSTGQHRALLDQALNFFAIQPDVDFKLMEPDQSPNGVAGRLLGALDPLLSDAPPDWILVQGDTTTAMASAVAAFHRRVRVGHVEAGLRTGDLQSPFPEELNRRIVDLAADLLFAPTPHAARHLEAEGVATSRIHVTGNTVVDALVDVAGREGPVERENLVLITAHRRENLGAPLVRIVQAIGRLARSFPDTAFVHVRHPNPNVAEVVEQTGGPANLHVLSPVEYAAFIGLIRRARLILTDSGGIQEEAPTFGTPVLVLRNRTERLEGLESGNARLVGTEVEGIVEAATRLLTNQRAWQQMSHIRSPYGDGRAADRIVRTLAGEPVAPFAGGDTTDHPADRRTREGLRAHGQFATLADWHALSNASNGNPG